MNAITWADLSAGKSEVDVRIAALRERFGDQSGYLHLAVCAAFPPILTFDLLAKIAQNFPLLQHSFREEIMTITADILLSSLCEPLGQGMYQMYEKPKQILLKTLRQHENYGDDFLHKLAFFLDKYRQECAVFIPTPALADVFRFTALTKINPKQASEEFLKAYEAGEKNKLGQMRRLGEEIVITNDNFLNTANPFHIAMQIVYGVELFNEGRIIDGISRLKSLFSNISPRQIPTGIRTVVPEEIWDQLWPKEKGKRMKEDLFPIPREILSLGIEMKYEATPKNVMKVRNSFCVNDKGELLALNCSSNNLKDDHIVFIWNQIKLQFLNLSDNLLTNVSIPCNLEELRFLDLSSNRTLIAIEFECGLSKLENIFLYDCNLRDLVFRSGFQSLRVLMLQRNKLDSFKIEGDCPSLMELDLSKNLLKGVEINSNLSALEILLLQGGNQIRTVEFLQSARSLETLNLSDNNVQDLTPIRHLLEKGVQFKWEKSGDGVLVEDCPLTTPPPEMVKEGNEAILNYFQEQDTQGTDSIYETKLLIVGEGGAGKTSLCRRLLDVNAALPGESESTKGIDIHRFEFPISPDKNFRVNIWDFGGQEIYHATHQLFFTKRSLYLLLDDTKKDYKSVQDEGFKYWLEVIDLLGGDSPVLIFQNEKGGHSKAIDLTGIKGRFGNVKECYSGDLSKKDTVEKIREAIIFQVKQLPHIGEQLPKKWILIRQEVETLAEEKAYISQEMYFAIYEKHLPFDREKALYLSRFFHDLGTFMHFQEDELLARTVILQNTWATEAVFKVLDDERIKEKLGRFDAADCSRIWADSIYADKHLELRALMMKFEFCYLLRDSSPLTWLAPQLLQPSTPEKLKDWEKPGDLVIGYEYDFMPKGLVNRLMMRQHRFVKQPDLGWKSGVLFELNSTQLLTQVAVKGDEIILRARGPERKELMSIIAADLDGLNDSYNDLSEKVVKKIPCICETCQLNTHPESYDYQELIRRRTANKKTIECRASYADVLVNDLLDGIEVAASKLREMGGKKKIFFSYSKHDREYLEQCLLHLSPLKRLNKIEPWEDHRILPGEEWDREIKQELAEADIILLFVSSDFLATDYIWDIEIKQAMARHERGEAIVVPIILRECDWEGSPFSKLNGLPTNGNPVASFTDRDEAWLSVVNGIEKLFNNLHLMADFILVETLTEGIYFEILLVEGGTFLMGSEKEEAFDREQPVHEVMIPSFYIGKYPVTQALWQRVMGNNPSNFKGEHRPVENVSWLDTQEFIQKLNELTGRNYRLLTEAEWEYAARGGQQSQGYQYAGSNKLKDIGWYSENSYGETKPVGLKYPNELGLYDMSGNVWEWVEDYYYGNYKGAPDDGAAWVEQEKGASRVFRGGSWNCDARFCRATYRYGDAPTFRYFDFGFRLGLSLQ